MSKNCNLCDKKLSFWNQPVFGKGILKSKEKICSSCFMKINKKSPKLAANLKQYELVEIIALLESNTNVQPTKSTVGFKVTTSVITETKDDAGKWEVVHRKTERWKELGFGDNEKFPGYGRLYEREFEIWYCDIGSKDRKDIQRFTDKYPLNYDPRNYQEIVGDGIYIEQLSNSKGYDALYTALDNKNRKRWYFALISKKPLWIETERAIEKEVESEDKIEIEVPEGWSLVQNHSERWKELGYDKGFPGYGKIHEITFDMWYCDIGSKEKNNLTELKAELAIYKGDNLYYFERVYKQIEELEDVHLNFEQLARAKEYLKLYNVSYRKKRWYLGVKEMTPRYVFTAGAN